MAHVDCPFCGECIEVLVDLGGGAHQEYVEDCWVCCRPIRFVISPRGGAPEDDAGFDEQAVHVSTFRE